MNRRGFITGVIALVAAPAIVRVSSLMPVRAIVPANYLSLAQITRESVQMFLDSNTFLANFDRQYDDLFARDNARIGSALRIRLPTYA
jgi:hypothetical protein